MQGRAFGGKNCYFLKPLILRPLNRQNLPNFGGDLENFCSISHLTLGVSWVNTPYSSLPIKGMVKIAWKM